MKDSDEPIPEILFIYFSIDAKVCLVREEDFREEPVIPIYLFKEPMAIYILGAVIIR